jgi:hypothetical protein
MFVGGGGCGCMNCRYMMCGSWLSPEDCGSGEETCLAVFYTQCHGCTKV